MTLKTRWIDTIYRLATGSQKIRNFFTPIGALFYSLLIFLFVVLSLQLDRLLGIAQIIPERISIIIAIPIFFLALVLIGWSVLNFLKARGTPVPSNPPPKLVASGPYAFVRNPMLSGIFTLLIGLSAFFGSISLLALFTPLFIAINVWELKAIEEPELLKRLGHDYMEYRKKTPMFFPRVGKILKKK